MSFSDLHLPDDLIAALGRQLISEPTPIQTQALPVLLKGQDAYLHAETGTGKTLAYLLPLFCGIDPALAATQAIIVAPTHELAIQIHRQCTDLAQNAGRAIRSVLLIGFDRLKYSDCYRPQESVIPRKFLGINLLVLTQEFFFGVIK